jgi:hypothetical protein
MLFESHRKSSSAIPLSATAPCSFSSIPPSPLLRLDHPLPSFSAAAPFLGDTRASQVVALTEEVTAVVQNARPERGDKVGVSLLRCIELDCMACFVLHCTVLYCTVL